MNNYAPWMQSTLDTYAIWTHTVSHQQWLNLVVAYSEAGATILETATVDATGHLECHVLDHEARIHAVYTLIDVPAIGKERRPL